MIPEPGDVMVWLDVRSQEVGYQGAVPFENETAYFQMSVNVPE
jgi:hypothetical protein